MQPQNTAIPGKCVFLHLPTGVVKSIESGKY